MKKVATAHFKTKYLDETCDVFIGRYPMNRSMCFILLRDPKTGEDVSNPTACLSCDIDEGYVLVKDYSESEGMLKALQEAGIIGESIYTVSSGFVELHVCQLRITDELWNQEVQQSVVLDGGEL